MKVTPNVYYDGIFLTTVTQGRAKTSPMAMERRYRHTVSSRMALMQRQLLVYQRRIEELEKQLRTSGIPGTNTEEPPIAATPPLAP